jgi:hypothetical protein
MKSPVHAPHAVIERELVDPLHHGDIPSYAPVVLFLKEDGTRQELFALFACPSDPFTQHSFAQMWWCWMERRPQAHDCEVAQQIAHIGLIAIMMRQVAIEVFRFSPLIHKGIWFDFDYVASGRLGAQIRIIPCRGTWKINQLFYAILNAPKALLCYDP